MLNSTLHHRYIFNLKQPPLSLSKHQSSKIPKQTLSSSKLTIQGTILKSKCQAFQLMVKPTTCEQSSPAEVVDINSSKYKGVRKRKWGRWVSEIRLPNSRERIWLGSYDSAEKAARAFDAAVFCLRGRDAKFNFPENPPDIAGGRSLSTSEIQVAAARFAREVETGGDDNNNLETEQYTSSSSVSVSDGTAATTQVEESGHHHDEEMTDWSFLSMLDNHTNYQEMSDYGFYFSGGDQLYPPPPQMSSPPPVDDGNGGDAFSQSSFLWNF